MTTDPLHSLTSVTRHRGEDTHNRQVSPIISSSAETGSAQLRVLISSPTRGKDGASTLVCKRQHEIDSPNHRRFRVDKSRNDFTNASTATSRVASADPDALLLDRPSYIRQFPSTERSHVDFVNQDERPQQRAVSQEEFKRMGNIIGQSISAKTRTNTYDRYVEGWVKFISDTWGYTGCAWLIGVDRLEQIAFIVLWLEHLSFEGLDINKGIPALRLLFTQNGGDPSLFSTEQVQRARTTLKAKTIPGRDRSILREQHYRSPMILEMVEHLREVLWANPSGSADSVYQRMTYLAVAFAFNFGLRAQEICHSEPGNDAHALRTEDIVFEDAGANRFTPEQVRKLSLTERSRIVTFRGEIRSDKGQAIAESKGSDARKSAPKRPLFISRSSSASEAQLLDDLIEWTEISFIKPGDLLFSRWSYSNSKKVLVNKRLLRKDVSSAQKLAASHLELPVSIFSSHCNRISTGAILKAGGHSSETIRQFGGWKSDAGFLYQRGSVHDPSTLREAEQSRDAGQSVMSLTDIKSMIPIGYVATEWHYGIHYGKRHPKSGQGFVTRDYTLCYQETNGVSSVEYKKCTNREDAEQFALTGTVPKRQRL